VTEPPYDAASTSRLTDINPGADEALAPPDDFADSSNPDGLTPATDALLFGARPDATDYEPWKLAFEPFPAIPPGATPPAGVAPAKKKCRKGFRLKKVKGKKKKRCVRRKKRK
jgi:hypothetical protein